MKTSCVQDNLFVWPLLLLLTVKCFFKRWQFWNHQINGSLIWSSYQKMTERDHDFLCKYRNFGWRFMKNLQRISVFGYRVECDYCVTMEKENGIKTTTDRCLCFFALQCIAKMWWLCLYQGITFYSGLFSVINKSLYLAKAIVGVKKTYCLTARIFIIKREKDTYVETSYGHVIGISCSTHELEWTSNKNVWQVLQKFHYFNWKSKKIMIWQIVHYNTNH